MKTWKVPIGGHLYTVTLEREVEDGEASGCIDDEPKTIKIDEEEADTEFRLLRIYTHEIIHGYQLEQGWGEILGKKEMELWAEGLTNQLMGSFEMKIKKY